MRIKILLFIILFYLLALLQTSFLVHFAICGMVPNFIFALVIIWNIFEKADNRFGLYQAAIGGFFLDIFSSRLIGFNILILIGIVVFLKIVFKRYVQIPFIKKN